MLLIWLVNALGLFAAGYLLPGIEIPGPLMLALAAGALGLVNLLLRPLILFLTLPINLLTLGLFTWVVDAALIWLVAGLAPGFEIDGFFSALLAAVIIAVLNAVVAGR